MLDRSAALAKAREAKRQKRASPQKEPIRKRREPLAISINEAEELSPMKRSKIYELINDGTLKSTIHGKNRMIDFQSFKQVVLGTAE